MTTTINISAYCTNDKQVQIDYAGQKQKIIQDGETFETIVYDEISCTVREVEKAQAESMNGDGQTRPPKDED